MKNMYKYVLTILFPTNSFDPSIAKSTSNVMPFTLATTFAFVLVPANYLKLRCAAKTRVLCGLKENGKR